MPNKELIAALEAADGPSKTLMWAALDHIHGIVGGNEEFLRRFRELIDAEAWESAALMLVPEGWDVDLFTRERFNLARLEHRVLDDEVEGKNAATPALAIVIAAIKAGGEG